MATGPSDLRGWFDALAERSNAEQRSALDELARRDPELARQVSRLLKAHGERGEFLEKPVPAQLATESDLAGETVGPYRILRTISQGGMGVVYEAVRADFTFKKRVALKMIRTVFFGESWRERFRVERQILAAMDHPNIARILDGGTTPDGRPYLVMEFVEGLPVTRYAEENGLGLAARLALFAQLCEATGFAHRNLIVHRDLKPANILVTAEGRVKLLDFGIAKILGSQPELGLDSSVTGAVPMMTPDYSSPEQIAGGMVTTATDVFQLGLVLYELLSGVHPFRGEGQAAMAHQVQRAICEDEPARPSVAAATASGWRKRLAGDLDRITLMALRKDPVERYSSVEALAQDIERHLQGRPVAAQGDRLSYRAIKFARRRWLPLAAAVAVFGSLTGAVAISSRAARVAEQQRAIAETRRTETERQRLRAERAAQEARLAGVAAEQGRLEAEQQRLRAERSAREAQLARVAAEQGRAESERQRTIAEAERARSERNMEAQRTLAMSLLGTSELQFRTGDAKASLANLEKVLETQRTLAGNDARDLDAIKIMGVLEVRICAFRASLGDTAGGAAICKAAIDRLEPLLGSRVNDRLLRMSLSAAYGTYGRLRTTSQDAAGGVAYGRKAQDVIETLVAEEPGNKDVQQLQAANQAYLGEALFGAGERTEALAQFGQAVERLRQALKTNPANRQVVLGFAGVLARQSVTLLKAGDPARAREALSHAITLFRGLAEGAGATELDFNEYANALVRYDISDLWQPDVAMRFAQRAVQGTDEKNPAYSGYLDTLAWAHFRKGDAAAAVETQRRALRALDGNGGFLLPGLRQELETGLKVFEAAADKNK